MSELELFKGNALANTDLFKSLQDINKNLLSGGAGDGLRRISLKGGKFREFVGGEQIRVSTENGMNVVIVNAAPISRTYYAGAYDPNNAIAPHCWSADTQTPAKEVPEDQRQSARCADCPQNIRGSGQGESRACRFGQRLAIAIEGKLDTVYQLQLPATSIFGDAKDGKMPMQAYAKFLQAHNTPAIAIVTEMYFDVNSEVPKLFFKPVRPLEEDELKQVVEMKDHTDTIKAITLTVAQTDGVQKIEAPKPEPKPEPEAKPEPKQEAKSEDDEPIEEPKKVVKKSTPAPKADDDDLSAIVDGWDD